MLQYFCFGSRCAHDLRKPLNLEKKFRNMQQHDTASVRTNVIGRRGWVGGRPFFRKCTFLRAPLSLSSSKSCGSGPASHAAGSANRKKMGKGE